MQEGYKVATRVPFRTVEQCKEALELCVQMARMADPAMISDVGSGALMAHAGAQAAAYNVRINLPSIDDPDFHTELSGQLTALMKTCAKLAGEVANLVEEAMPE
jgi:formiminotetrahydrofolate cyclodeaminase